MSGSAPTDRPPDAAVSRGRVSVHPRGFGFVLDAAGRSAFVVPPELNPFLADDEVEYTLESQGDRHTARQLRLVARPRQTLFGTAVRHGRALFLKVDRLVANTDWPLTGAANPGDAVLARIEGGQAVVAEILTGGEAEIARLLCRHDLRGAHDPAVTTAAEALRAPDLDHRRDLRGEVTVTIDGPDTRDIDDALLALPPDADGALRVIVAIADVSALVAEGSALDADARARATSVYLPGRVLPMLPPRLSEDRLSLLEGADRPALTVELRIDAEGEVTAVDVHEAAIRSTARLTYDAVTRFLEEGDAEAVPTVTHATLRRLRAASARLSQARAARGGKDVEREEISVRLDEQGAPVGLEARRSDVAHVLVERLMVAANEAVARYLVERGLPGLFRVHESPSLERTQALAAAAEALGVVAGFSETAPLTPRALAAFDRQIRGTRSEALVESAARRLLGPARYTGSPGLHFGLAAPLYLHFTSPIRRYADLAVHRILRRYLRGERGLRRDDPALEPLCAHVNEKAHRAARAEAERERVLVSRLFERRLGQQVRAVVVGHKPQGALVQVDGALALLAGETPPLGAALRVEIAAVDTELGRIDVRRVPDPSNAAQPSG
jgi:ribonuclease R